MAAGLFTFFDIAKERFAKGELAFGTHVFKAVIVGQATPLTSAFAGTSTSCLLSDLTQITGAGYTAGGATVTISVNRSGATVKLDAPDTVWTGSLEGKWAVLYNDTHASDALVGFVNLNTASGTAVLVSTDAPFTVDWNAAGIFTLA